MNYFDLKGQVAVVTGCSTGLGVQMANALANQGCKIVAIARRMDMLEQVCNDIAKEHGVETMSIRCDITKTDEIEETVKQEEVKSFVVGDKLAVYNISLTRKGSEIQPENRVTVRIPCDDPKAKVYRVEEDGSLTDMNAVYEDGFLVFYTDHFSLYAVVGADDALPTAFPHVPPPCFHIHPHPPSTSSITSTPFRV